MEGITSFAPFLGIAGLVLALIIYLYVIKLPQGSNRMMEIAEMIHSGAMVYLKRQYIILIIFVIAVAIALGIFINFSTSIAYIAGAICSMLAGFFGMKGATKANVRTAEAANRYKPNAGRALYVAFMGGSVMGLSVASLGLIGVGVLFIFFGKPDTAAVITGFAMGASTIAFFARVGGGIYTKTADVGSDLVGKVEAGIPEDDPRNPGVIADNVGDNVGDVAGLGADIFESYVGSIIATIALAATATVATTAVLGSVTSLMTYPIILTMLGLVSSIIGVLAMSFLQRFNPAAALKYSAFMRSSRARSRASP
jgi:K(+)-stimulated pyrophosphate-energized sodium pump